MLSLISLKHHWKHRNIIQCRLYVSSSKPYVHPRQNRDTPSREEQLSEFSRCHERGETFDLLVVGGGATGCGTALDAATRGLRAACVERGDFACETSSRSTKLIWAGICE